MQLETNTELSSIECLGCERGQALCRIPCWGSPDDIEKLILKGLGPNLMLNIFYSQNFELVQVLGPALPEYKGRFFFGHPSASSATGCIFQDSHSKLCTVHESKPTEGKIACCKRFSDAHGEHETQQIRYSIAHRWTEAMGKNLVSKWKRNYLKDLPLDDDHLRLKAANLIAQRLTQITTN